MATNPRYVEAKYLDPQTHALPPHDAIMIEGNVPFIEFTLLGLPRGGIQLTSADGLTKRYQFTPSGTNSVSVTGGIGSGKTRAGATAPLLVHRGANALIGAQNLALAMSAPGRGHGVTGGDPKFRVSVTQSAGVSALGNRGVMRIHQAVAGEEGLTSVAFDGSFGPSADHSPQTVVFKLAPGHIQTTENHIVGGDNAHAELILWGGRYNIKRGASGRPIEAGGTGPIINITGQTFGSGGYGLENNREIIPMQVKGIGEVKGFNVYGLKD